MAEFLEMNSHMKSWLNSLILNYSWFSFKFLSVKENVLLIQSNHHPSFAVSTLQGLRLLCGCCLVATRRFCCYCRRRVLCTAEQGGCGGPCGQGRNWHGDLLSLLVSKKETSETFKSWDYRRDQPQGQNPDGAIGSLEGLQQMIVIQCTTANFQSSPK